MPVGSLATVFTKVKDGNRNGLGVGGGVGADGVGGGVGAGGGVGTGRGVGAASRCPLVQFAFACSLPVPAFNQQHLLPF